MRMSLLTRADDLSIENGERREERRRSVAFVIARHRSGAPAFNRQARLGAVQSLNLTLLIDAKH